MMVKAVAKVRSPRIAVTVPPDVHRVLLELSELTGEPTSRFVADLVRESAPYLAKIAGHIRSLKDAEAQKRGYVEQILAQAETEARTAADTTMGLLDRLSGIEKPAGAPRRPEALAGSRKASHGRKVPPPANRGDEK